MTKRDGLLAAGGWVLGVLLLPLSLLVIAAGLVLAFVAGGCAAVWGTFWPD